VTWSHAEAAVTIIAASIPILRALLKRDPQAPPSPSPANRARFFSEEKFTMQSQSTVVIESRRRSADQIAEMTWAPENRSNRNSMEDHPHPGKILQISEIAIEYSELDDMEMGRKM
jgi:hypothetical protein